MRFGYVLAAGAAFLFGAPSFGATVIEGFAAADGSGRVQIQFSSLLPGEGMRRSFNIDFTGGAVVEADFSGIGEMRQSYWEFNPGYPPYLNGNSFPMSIGCGVTPGTSCTDNFVSLAATTFRVAGITEMPMSGPFDCDTRMEPGRICYQAYDAWANLTINLQSTTGVNYRLTYSTAPIPEPGSWAMLIGGLGLVGGALRRRRVNPERPSPAC